MNITQIGQYNEIDSSVQFIPFKDCEPGPVIIGDCNVIHDSVRILVGPDGFRMGDWNIIHNHCTIGGPGPFVMGHNCWFGQEVWLDSSGGLTLGDGVRVGVRSHVWTHIASGEQIEGWLCAFRPTVLEDDVWLVGDDVHVASGVRMGARSAAMAHSTVTRDTLPDTVYAGTPAREVSFRLRRDVSLDEKMEMMSGWAREFCKQNIRWVNLGVIAYEGIIRIGNMGDGLYIGTKLPSWPLSERMTFFNLTNKTYTKRLTPLERDFIRFLQGNKARFLPVEAA